MNPSVKYEFQMIMISRSIDCSKRCTVMQVSVVGEAEVGVGRMGVDRNSICFPFSFVQKTALKNEAY